MAANKATKPRKSIISVTVIRITCICGGTCDNEDGSSMIEYFHKTVWCEECGKRYDVPENAFRSVAIFYTQDTSKMSFEDLKDLGDHLASVKSDEAFFRGMSEG